MFLDSELDFDKHIKVAFYKTIKSIGTLVSRNVGD